MTWAAKNARDGLALSPSSLSDGLLCSSQILACLRQGLLLKNYDEHCLRSATYDMRLGDSAWRFVNGKRLEFHLGPEIDTTRNVARTLVFAPNSLTFVSTIESFNLPADVIARFNLKSRWVHKGLLLGTAPLVEPQFQGKMLLPIHNFSSNIVQMDYAEPLLAVEFTKTLPPGKDYIENDERIGNLHNYLDSLGVVESAVYKAINRSESLLENIRGKTKFFSIAGGISLFLLICANLSLLVNIFNTAENARKQSVATQGLIGSFSEKNKDIEDRFRKDLEAIKLDIQMLKDSGKNSAKTIELIERINRLENIDSVSPQAPKK